MRKMGRGSVKKRHRGQRPVEDIADPQRRTLSTIRAFNGRKGHSPTVKELAAELGMRAQYHTERGSEFPPELRAGTGHRDAFFPHLTWRTSQTYTACKLCVYRPRA